MGPVLFNQSLIVYLMYIAIFAVWFGLFHTRWGLRLRSVGEHPKAADTVGINVTGTRYDLIAVEHFTFERLVIHRIDVSAQLRQDHHL